ncbi:hypothetical protein L195_g051497 [Trifolium pratense]|uniref:Uncharacterized protein n=1 Tax=Trifolium pratense TaxID=57577 RepID=A0A2K3JZV5_TRIPR|nr:hypothetical protein L195_g051497 [Trifolium pratense]
MTDKQSNGGGNRVTAAETERQGTKAEFVNRRGRGFEIAEAEFVNRKPLSQNRKQTLIAESQNRRIATLID